MPSIDGAFWEEKDYEKITPKANDCVVDKDIHTDEDEYYTLLVTEPTNRPSNATKENYVTWLDAGNFLDGQISFRMLPKGALFLQGLSENIKSNTPSPYRPETAFCSRQTFERGGYSACRLENNTSK